MPSPSSLPQLTAQRPSALSSQSGSDSAPQCLLLERRGDAKAEAETEAQQDKENTVDTDCVPSHPGTPTDPLAEALVNGDNHTKAPSPVPSRVSSPRSPCSSSSPKSPRSPRSPHSPCSPGSASGHNSSHENSQKNQNNSVAQKPKDLEKDFCHVPSATKSEPNQEEGGVLTQALDQNSNLTPSSPSPAAPHKDPTRRQSRIPVLEPSSLLELPPPGSAKEKLLQKKAVHQGPVPSPTASPSLSDRRGPLVASLAKDPLSSTSDRSQDEDSLMGSPSDRQGDDAPSLSSSSSPLSRKSRIPRPVHSASSAEQLAAQFLPRPPPGKPPCRGTVEGR